MIEKFEGTLKKNREKENEMPPYKVQISPELISKVKHVLTRLNISPTVIPNNLNPDEPLSIVSSTVLDEFVEGQKQIAGVVSWAPPLQNWNPWSGCNIDEGYFATANLDDIRYGSFQIFSSHSYF